MNKQIIIVLTLLLTMITVSAVQAQEAIDFGQSVTAEMTASEYEFRYKFAGTTGEIIVFEMNPVDIFGDLDSPVLTLFDGDGEIVVDTSEGFSFSSVTMAVEIPADGSYTILATRADGADGDSVGEFTLTMIQPTAITAEEAIEDNISSESGDQYYVVQSDSPFSLLYKKATGDYYPEINVHTIDEEIGRLEKVATIGGEVMTTGLIGVFDADMTYVITVEESLLSFYMSEVTADYSLEIITEE